jgi:hypothetical protein
VWSVGMGWVRTSRTPPPPPIPGEKPLILGSKAVSLGTHLTQEGRRTWEGVEPRLRTSAAPVPAS